MNSDSLLKTQYHKKLQLKLSSHKTLIMCVFQVNQSALFFKGQHRAVTQKLVVQYLVRGLYLSM